MRKAEAVIIGYTKRKGSKDTFAALVLGVYEDGLLHYAGLAASGFGRTKPDLLERMRRLQVEESPFAESPVRGRANWLKPLLIAEVSHEGRSKDKRSKRLKKPKFLGLKERLMVLDA